ncbi:MAG TPA: Holliday junction resolvase RecU [Blastocatellia bacterium]|nr:Holliday junction resolvase RecU [Blastocatellia bacterium]
MNLKRRGAETGSGFQEAINRINEGYERAGRACVTRKAIPGKYLIERGESRRGLSLPAIDFASNAGQQRLSYAELCRLRDEYQATDWRKFVPESKAEPDYGGVIAPEGRAIFYDAKTTRRNLLDFDNLHAHQITFLERAARFGAVAGFLVEFSNHAEVYFLPIQIVVRWREEVARKSLPYRFLAEHLTPAPQGKGLIIFDYLNAIEEQEKIYGRDFEKFVLIIPSARSQRKISAGKTNS